MIREKLKGLEIPRIESKRFLAGGAAFGQRNLGEKVGENGGAPDKRRRQPRLSPDSPLETSIRVVAADGG